MTAFAADWTDAVGGESHIPAAKGAPYSGSNSGLSDISGIAHLPLGRSKWDIDHHDRQPLSASSSDGGRQPLDTGGESLTPCRPAWAR